MASGFAVIVSPHLDDAVLSCWHLLGGDEGARVLNVFTGSPTANGALPWWDRMTGATDSVERMRERFEEDRQALALAGAEAAGLGFLDEQYRTAEQPVGPIVEALVERLAGIERVYAPAALGSVQDHLIVRTAALELRTRGIDVRLYADLPHAVTEFGWPGWVTRQATPLDPGPRWSWMLGRTGVPSRQLIPRVHPLDAATRARKLEAIRAYRSQLRALDALFGGVERPESLAYEVTWSIEAPGQPSGG